MSFVSQPRSSIIRDLLSTSLMLLIYSLASTSIVFAAEGPQPSNSTILDETPISLEDLPEVKRATTESDSGYSIEYELDPYYTNVAAIWPFGDDEIKNVGEVGEFDLYRVLAVEAFNPRFILVEASINPLPILGTYIRSEYQQFYEDTKVSRDINLIQALSEGFEEPYALSLFMGNVVHFGAQGEQGRETNKGYTGVLVSIGDQHIKSNRLIEDRWLEVEVKLKGDRRFNDRNHSWSFRVGAKRHKHPGISDVYYLGIRRSHFNSDESDPSPFKNMGIDYRLAFDQSSGSLVEQRLFFDKNWPISGSDQAFTMGVGLVVEKNKYKGSLAEDNGQSDYRLMLRPGFTF